MADTRAWLERRQRDVGRQALGCHGQVAIEAIQGDVGWSTFEAREAASKLCYRGRLLHMDKGRWARRIFDYLGLRCLQTRWEKRVYQLRKKNGFFTDPVQEDSEGKWAREVRGRVRDAETAHWMEEAGKKSTLDVYRAHKHNIRAEDFYDNSLGSRLLFEARAGALRTLAYRQRFDPTIMTIQCRLCDQEAETIEHLVLRCPALTPKWELADTQADQASSHDCGRQATPPASVHGDCGVAATTAPQPAQAPPLSEALRFQEAADTGAHPAERWVVRKTKQRLANWWKKRE
ncbi:hypothetical protein HPB47_009934 [Ixodes persulcatus]|uniref:Uncharacterized protein n=1 Tax=Ixodes persulcatus TaxID=34615 RepID=A0AC60P160_IXOPE|nr:hypothetical protein HPB47_009934 [Ixodes persulcatus]